MKEKEEDDEAKPKSANESTQLTDWPAHVEWKHQPNYAGYQLIQGRKRRIQWNLPTYRFIICFVLFQNELSFHIGGF